MFDRSKKGEHALLIQPHFGKLEEDVLEEFGDLETLLGAPVPMVTAWFSSALTAKPPSPCFAGISGRAARRSPRPGRQRHRLRTQAPKCRTWPCVACAGWRSNHPSSMFWSMARSKPLPKPKA